MARAHWAGRFEIIKKLDRTFIFDGAHNAGGAEAFRLTYEEVFKDRQKTVVLSVLKDKEVKTVVEDLVNPYDTVITVPAPTPRTSTPEELAEFVPGVAQTAQTVSEGMQKAMAATQAGDIIVVAGSLYILGEAEEWLKAQ